MILVFTICSNNYLAQAITLGQSLLKHNPTYEFKIGLVDRKSDAVNYINVPYEVIDVETIGISAFDDMFKRYSITELNTAVKPFFFDYFFRRKEQIYAAIYLDPDILVYSPFQELEEELENSNIVITPHFTTPIDDDKEQAENDFLNAGLYNLGFIAVKRSNEADRFIQWWSKRLETKAFNCFSKGMFTDQLWINFVPLYFKSVSIFRHPGYNLAYWNLHERAIDNDEVVMMGNKFKLVFIHFSGFNPLKNDVLSKYQNRFDLNKRKDLSKYFLEYASLLIKNDYNQLISLMSYYSEEKKKLDALKYQEYKRSIPMSKRILRGIILRFIAWFKISSYYYLQDNIKSPFMKITQH